MSMLDAVRGVVETVSAALGVEGVLSREEPQQASPQDSYSLTLGEMLTDSAGTCTFRAIPGRVDLAQLPSSFMDKEVQMYTVALADCLFPPARGMTWTPGEGALAGVALPVVYAKRRAADSAIDFYTMVRSRSAGLPSDGEDL